MNIQNLKIELEQAHDLVCFYDLADAMSSHGKIFKIFKNHYQSSYSPTQKIVFYTSDCPSQLVLDHLQRAATTVDISNYFITLCTPHNVKSALEEANAKYGNDSVSINWHSCVLEATRPIDSDNIYPFDTFCTLPFGFISVTPNNMSVPCCKYQGATGMFDHQFDFDSQLDQVRQDIKRGQRHKNCSTCWNAEDLGQVSMRQHFINKYIDQCESEWVDRPYVRDLTIAPSNLCNFKCRICTPVNSTKIAVEELKFSSDLTEQQTLKTIINWPAENKKITDKIFQLAPNLEFLHFLGGEPFLWQDLELLIDQLIAADLANHLQLEFNTNGSIFPDQIIDRLLKFKSVEVLISIDDIESRFELQRGGDWPTVLQHILKFNSLKSSTFNVKIAPTVNIQNVLYLDHLVNFCENENLEIVWCFLESPQYLCIDHITAAAKDAVFNKYANHRNSELQSIAHRVYQTAPVTGDVFLNYMKKLDQRRGQDSAVVLKEIIDAMSR